MLDFKLDGGLSAQTYEGVDYSDAKNTQFQAELLGIMDMGKRERRNVKYNENQLYQQQVSQQGAAPPKKKQKKDIKLPRMLRLPRLEEWQMFDREALYALQEVEEHAFRALPPEVQKLAGVTKNSKLSDENTTAVEEQQQPNEEVTKDTEAMTKANIEEKPATDPDPVKEEAGVPNEQTEDPIPKSMPPLLTDDQKAQKARLLAEGFADWSRNHYSSFVKASAKYGRLNYSKIAADVGKPVSAVQTYARAFWDDGFGQKRFSEHEHDRVVKIIEKGEKKIEDIKGLQRGTKVLISLFENPWVELQFTHVNCKDKKFTADEDRFLLCWAHKVRLITCLDHISVNIVYHISNIPAYLANTSVRLRTMGSNQVCNSQEQQL